MKVDFIIFYKSEACLSKCVECINSLEVPTGVEVGTMGSSEGESITEVYEACRLESEADIKIYIREDVYIVARDFLYKVCEYMNDNQEVLLAGFVGGVMSETFVEWTSGHIYISNDDRQTVFMASGHGDVDCLLGTILISRSDMSWKDICDDRFDIEYSNKIATAGHKIGIIDLHENCLWEYGYAYKERRDVFLNDGRGWAYISDNMPLVSIVVPMHNAEMIIRDNIESLIKQTYSKLQIIMVDDCSSDDTCNIISEYAKKDSRIELIELTDNNHVCYATNEGYKLAQGKYVATLGHDDMWNLGKVEEQVAFMEHECHYAACFTYVHVVDEKLNIIDEKSQVFSLFRQNNLSADEWLDTFLFKGNFFCAPSAMLRREMIRKQLFRPYTVQLQDYDLWLDILLEHDIYILPEALTFYRQFSDEGTNLSSLEKAEGITPKEVRLYREVGILKYRFLMKMPNDRFTAVFGKYFRNSESSTDTEIMFEKGFLLYHLNCTHFVDVFAELLEQDENVEIMKEKFNLSLPDYYKLETKIML